jgi:aryl-alcohol dehydrogenase-like predicted oxidoreductase
MNYRVMGNTRLKVSEIGFGAWAIGGLWGPQEDRDSLDALSFALDCGVNLIDTAASYGNGKSERLICQVLRERKERVYIATKIPPLPGPWPPSPYCEVEDRYPERYIRENVEERCRNLGTDHLDILLLHTWTRAWNEHPSPLKVLRKILNEGRISHIGVSTAEHDQNALVDLMREGLVDVVEVVYNIFEQEPAAQFLPVAQQNGIGVISRVAFDEGSLTGKFSDKTLFAEGDFRRDYFNGDRLSRTVKRVEALRKDLVGQSRSLAETALLFVLAHPAIHTVIPGMRNRRQVEANMAATRMPALSAEILGKLHNHAWLKGFWYLG